MSEPSRSWSDELYLISEAFEVPTDTVHADIGALGHSVFSLHELLARPGSRPECWNLDYVRHYLRALLDCMPALEPPSMPSPS